MRQMRGWYTHSAYGRSAALPSHLSAGTPVVYLPALIVILVLICPAVSIVVNYLSSKQSAETDFAVDMNGEDCGAHVVSRSVAKDHSHQHFTSLINGNNKCNGHTECDAIIMDSANVTADPKLTANHVDASLIHEAAIGKIAGEQLIKLMTLGLSEKEAEEQIVNGFLK